ncbi:MAG: hypothetical protein GYA59_11375 [Chloroflexi bacterium]|nr:hypothetical protein [Chloroflexota bacterium]
MGGNNKFLIGLGAGVLLMIIVCGGIAVGVLALSSLMNQDTNDSIADTAENIPVAQPTTEPTNETVVNTFDTQAIKLVEKNAAYCKALAPEDWSFASTPPYVGADLFSPDKQIHAAWGISGIYTSLYPTDDAALNYLLSMVYQGFTLTGAPEDLGYGFWGREFNTGIGKKGLAIYKVYNFDPSFYVISVYMAATDTDLWETRGAQAISSAISIRCVSQMRPTTADLDLESADASDQSANPEVDLSENWGEAIMGYENVYSPTTGEHYLAPLNSYWAGGPDGGGYYRELPGGGYEKLSEGFGDY